MAIVNGTSGSDFIHVSGDGLPVPAGHTDIPDASDDADTINSGLGGNDVIHAGGGDDTINFGADLDGADKIDGGNGFDVLQVNDQVFVTFTATSLTNIEEILIPSIPVQIGFAG